MDYTNKRQTVARTRVAPLTQALLAILLLALLILAAMLAATPAKADTGLAFPDVWKRVKDNSPTRQAAKFESEAASTARDRASRHWFPYVYLDARGFKTNDPGMSFISTLGQREITMFDFDPNKLNHPSAKVYERVTLGAALPLFEGGMRAAQASAAAKMAQAKELNVKTATRTMYTEAAKLYGVVLSRAQTGRDLETLLDHVEAVLGRYKIGAESNPVGYSGLLGLKGLRNRVAGLIAENKAQLEAAKKALEDMAGGLPRDWSTNGRDTVDFVKAYLDAKAAPGQKSSTKVEAFESMAGAAEEGAKAEKSKFLPRVGLFTEGYLNHGDRASAMSYVGGAYLQWDLFLAPNFGAISQAQNESAAARKHAEEARLFEGIETAGSMKAAEALESNLTLLESSSSLLDEQTRMARKLFLSGAMNALQLTEVFSRRADLINSLTEAKTQYLNVKATLANNTNFGVENE